MTNPLQPHFLTGRHALPSCTLTFTYPHTETPAYSPCTDLEAGWTHSAHQDRYLLTYLLTHTRTAYIHQLQTLERVTTQSPTLTFPP